jgi:uncharacterized protein (UPF0333 family)
MKKKTQLMLSFLVRLLIALIIFIPTIYFAMSFFRLSNEGVDSYKNLVSTINTGLQLDEINSEPLYMDERTQIFFFNKGEEATGSAC